MFKKWSLFAAIALLALFALAVDVQAATEKYTFNDVTVTENDAELTIEIEASTKVTKKAEYSTCSYYADDYAEYLGYYDAPVLAGDSAGEVLDFCVENFGNRDIS